jgi:hypothetical protein
VPARHGAIPAREQWRICHARREVVMTVESRGTSEERALDRKIDAAGWGVLFVWIGVALLAHVGWGVGLVGVGLITLGAQAWRNHVGVKVDRFGLVVGAVFMLVGVWNLFDVRVELVPVLFIAAGVYLLASARRRHRAPGHPVDAPAHPGA